MNRVFFQKVFKNIVLVGLIGLFCSACPPDEEEDNNGPVITVGSEGQPCRADLSCQEGLECVFQNGADVCLPVRTAADAGVNMSATDAGSTEPPDAIADAGQTQTNPTTTSDAGVTTPPTVPTDGGTSQGGLMIGPEGGTVLASGLRLVIPPGALSDPTAIEIVQSVVESTDAFQTYSPQFSLSPNGLNLTLPAQLELTHSGLPNTTAIFQSEDGAVYNNIGGTPNEQKIVKKITRFQSYIAANGVEHVRTHDLTTATARIDKSDTVTPAGVGLLVRVLDATGVPVQDLSANTFRYVEDETVLSWPTSAIMKKQPDRVFISLLLDFSGDDFQQREKIVEGTRAFLNTLHEKGVMASIAIKVFANDNEAYVIQDYTLAYRDLVDFNPVLDDILEIPPPIDGNGRNLNGALLQARSELDDKINNFQILNGQGGLTTGHIIVLTKGVDTAQQTNDADLNSVFDGKYPVWMLTLPSGQGTPFFPEVVQAHHDKFLDSDLELPREMGRIAFEIKQHSLGTYWLGYCSPSRSGTMDVSVKLVGSDVLPDSAVTVNASGFFEGCVAETLSESCSDRVCGGFGCGSCDERGSSCQPTSGQCISFCSQHCTEPGQYTNVYGYKQACFHECDQDFIEFPRDNCPFLTDDNLTDTDGDGDGDPCDDDDDNDTWLDENDDCPLGTQNWMPMTTNDYDEDGCYDPDEDTDDDNDGVVDNVDDCPYGARNWSSNETTDYDGDGCKDDLFEDLDDDNDAIPDLLDNCPQGEPGWVTSSEEDYDQDGCRDDTEDDDDDDDLIDDNLDACPLGENTWYSNPTTDNDGDGCKDASEEDLDDDNDGFLDDNDECPQGDTLWVSSVLTDHDSDGCQDSGEDLDDDGDEKVDAEDDCPKGVLGWASNDTNDVDDDGCHDDLEDLDDDNDTVEDLVDNCQYVPNPGQHNRDYKLDDFGNACDPDDDNDGLLDESDACPTGLLDWEALGDEDVDADGCRDAPFNTSILDQDNQVDLHDVEMYLSAGEVLAQFIDPSAHGDLTEYRIHNLFPERPTSFKLTLYRLSEPIIPGDDWDFVMTNENILYQGNHVILMDQTRLDIYFPVPQWVFNDSQIAMVMEVLGEAIVTEGETPSGAVVPNADGANLLRLGLTTSNKYPRGFLLDQDLRTDPAADDLEFELYFIPEEDLDDDNDSVADDEDNCPFTVNLGQLNNDADAQGDLCDDDDDNDGKLDEEDDCSKGEINWVSDETSDNDNDGCKDNSNEDPDDDNDTIPDSVDNCQFVVNSNQENVDLDQWGDACDFDGDNDGVFDEDDDCPQGTINWTANPFTDYDGDGCLDSNPEDPDDDNDGIIDIDDLCAKGKLGWISEPANDNDGDGCEDNEEDDDIDNDAILDENDNCPLDANNDQLDTDGDLIGDACTDDDDNDNIADEFDRCPQGLTNWAGGGDDDADSDGCHDTIEDNDDDNDEVDDSIDNCLFVSNPDQANNDNDANGDACDDDDDNDNLPDEDDLCPQGEDGWTSFALTDYDQDGCRDDGEDTDDDNDGVLDVNDNCAKGLLGWSSSVDNDNDQDGCEDTVEDEDDDNDNQNDANDNCLDVANPDQADIDGDGQGNACDDDIDNDGVLNDEDSCPAGDLNWVANAETDQDDDGCQDDSSEDLDDDNDSVLDDDDNCPLVTNTAQANHDNDEFGDVCDSDIDNDGLPNNEDACFAGDTGWTANSDTDGDGDGCRDDTEDLDDDNDGVEDSEDVCPAISDPYCTERVCGVVGTSYGVTSFDYGSDRYLVTINEYGERLISDSQTDLIWQGCEAGRAGDSCELGVSDTYSYGDAFNYCDTLVLDGYDDWRLGSVHEVNSLIRYNNANPALQDEVFLDSNASFYFSSPLVSGASGAQIYTQQIADGAVTVMDMWDENNNELVTPLRCVRKNGTNHQYHDDSHCLYRALSILTATGDGEPVVVQEKHDLMWQGCLSGFTGANCENGINDATEATLFSWSQANTHCEQLVWGGYSDWQLPDVHQVMGLRDFTGSSTVTLDALFQNNSSVSLWTSTPVAMAPDTQAWRIENGVMIVHAMNQTSNGGARCVRWEETIEATEPPEATDAGTMDTDAGLPNSGDNLDSGMP